MKRVLLALILNLVFAVQAQAKLFEESQVLQVKKVIKTQLKYSKEYDVDKLFSLYAPEFINSDGFNKDIYLKLVRETWETYPKIVYTTKIKKISVDQDFAQVEVYETAHAQSSDENGMGDSHLLSEANSVYFLEKRSSNWVITSEQFVNEKSSLLYGDARFVKMNLVAPNLVEAGKAYSVSLLVDMPANSLMFASIGRSKVTYPQTKPDDVFRRIPEDNLLERMFIANTDNVNEYTICSVGIPKDSKLFKNGGLAFIMTRVNVVPKNNFIKVDDEK
jgi:hypothetical protein